MTTESTEIERNPWPYCDAPGCHDPRTNQYLRGPLTFSGGSTIGPGQGRYVHTYYGPGSPLSTATRACRIHALQRFGVAITSPGKHGDQ